MRIVLRTKDDKQWKAMSSVAFSMEVELQKLLIESPSLLPMAEEAPGMSPPVLAVGEFGLPGAGFTDILAFSAEGDITIIECKLATNAEAKRKVIGQVLEYAAYLWQMTYDDVDRQVQQRLHSSLAEAMEKAVADPAWDAESFRQNVTSALDAGAFTLVIAVDGINEELARIIEYVNSRGRTGFALSALEMRLFKAGDIDILVPHLYGVETQEPGPARERRRWTEEEFLLAAGAALDAKAMDIIRDVLAWSHKEANRVFPGNGKVIGSLTFHYIVNERTVSVFTIYSDGRLMFNFGYLSAQTDPANVERFYQALAAIPSLTGMPHDLNKYPAFEITKAIPDDQALQAFKSAVERLGVEAQQPANSSAASAP